MTGVDHVVQPSRAAAEGEGQDGTDARVRGKITERPIVADTLKVTVTWGPCI